MTNHFLFELGVEELPPKLVTPLIDHLHANVSKQLMQAELSFKEIISYATPRRLALLITELVDKQPDRVIERKGPAIKAAFDPQGKPTPAALGFARSCGVNVDQLIEIDTDNGARLGYSQAEAGKTTISLLPDIFHKALASLPIPRPMRWGDNVTEFIRPVHWLVMLYGNDIVPAELYGNNADRYTYGHRFLAPEKLNIPQARDYAQLLFDQGKVIVDLAKRQQTIVQQAKQHAQQHNAQVLIDETLLREVVNIVEWPVACWCEFDPAFLQVPAEALIAAMQDHQKCFPIIDANNNLLANFIAISNIESRDQQQVIVGNQRVMSSRLADAKFFYETDCKQSLASRIEGLKHILFQAKLGTLYDRIERLQVIAQQIASRLQCDEGLAQRAALLCKTDLLTDLVYEFPELQGIMGYYYARNDNEPEEIALALREHYLPRYAKDELPTTPLGCIIAITDRIERLVAIFSINQGPTGEKDPFGLRRAAIGLLRIILEKNIDLDLQELIKITIASYQQTLENPHTLNEVMDFLFERLRHWYQSHDVSTNIIAAVLANKPTSPLDFQYRLDAVKHFYTLPEAESLAIANKRVKNILQKQATDLAGTDTFDDKVLKETAEKTLAQLIREKEVAVSPLVEQRDYVKVLTELATLKDPIDDFFDNVMVVVDDKNLRQNRLALLARLRNLFIKVADISLLP